MEEMRYKRSDGIEVTILEGSYFDTSILEHLDHVSNRILGLGNSQTIPRNNNNTLGFRKHANDL